jgi:hypothetical protein
VIVFRFYREDESAHFEEKKYRTPSLVPPIPRLGEKVALRGEMYMVVETPAHYFERIHEIALIVLPIELVDEEAEQPAQVEQPVVAHQAAPGVPLIAKGHCAYCDDPECPGGEDCNFYDGTLG